MMRPAPGRVARRGRDTQALLEQREAVAMPPPSAPTPERGVTPRARRRSPLYYYYYNVLSLASQTTFPGALETVAASAHVRGIPHSFARGPTVRV